MNAKLLLEHYERIADAPGAISRLRSLVLSLAVRGKLVPQVPETGKHAQLAVPRMGDIEPPFQIPATWHWARLDDLGGLKGGGTPSKSRSEYWDGSIPWVSPKDMKSDYIERSQMSITQAAVEGSAVSLLPAGSILFVVRGMILAHSFPVAIARLDVTINQDMKAVVLKMPEMGEFILRALKGLKGDMLRHVKRSSHGTCRLEGADYRDFLVPIPPRTEQAHIVAKVDELMTLCDKLEKARTERETRRDNLTTATLARLNTPNTKTFRSDARFALDNLQALTSRPDQIKQLRQTILTLAVRGQLVAQESGDEASSDLLHRIAIDFEQRVQRGELNPQKPVEPLPTRDPPFSLPRRWSWARFNQVAAIQSNLVDPKQHPTMPHIAPDNIEAWTGHLLPYSTIAEAGVFSSKHFFKAGAILYSKIRPNLAKVTKADFAGLCSADMYPIHALIERDFLVYFMISEDFVKQAVREDNRVAMPKINQVALSNILVPVPPLPEQRRIAARVSELLSICDDLQHALTAEDTTRVRVLDALLTRSLQPEPKQGALASRRGIAANNAQEIAGAGAR